MAGVDRRVLVQVLADTTGFQRSMGRAAGATGRLNSALGGSQKGMGMLKGAALGVGVAVAGGLAASVRAFAEFEDKLNQSLAIMGDVSDRMRGEMSDAAREVGKTTRFAASEAAESFFFLASAGLDAEQSIAALPVVSAFAQAGMFDLATATDLATDAQSALGLSVKDPVQNMMGLTRVTDVLVKANTLANASVQQFSEALTNKAGSALKLLGKDVEEGVAVLAAFADQGVKGTEAGERLNIVLRDLQTSSIRNRDVWDELGLKVFDASGEMRGISDIVGDLSGALEGASDEQARLTLMALGFQDRSVSAIMTLLGLQDKIAGYEDSLRSAAGITQEVADKQMESLAAKLDLLKGAFTDAAIAVGEDLAPAIDSLIVFVTSVGPAVAASLKAVAGYLKLVGDGVVALRSLLGGVEATQMIRLNEAIEAVTDAQAVGGDEAVAYANGLMHLLWNSSLTAESMSALGDTTELSAEQIAAANADVLASVRGLIDKGWGLFIPKAKLIEDQLYSQIMALGKTSDEVETLVYHYDLMEAAARAGDSSFVLMEDAAGRLAVRLGWVNTGLGETGDAAEGLKDPMGDAAAATGGAADAAQTLYEKLQAAKDAQESLTDVMLAAADPVFGAVKAFADYQDTLKDIDKDGKRTAQEQLDLAEATLKTQAAFDMLKGAGLTEGVDAISQALGETRGHTLDLLGDLGILEDRQIRTLIELEIRPLLQRPIFSQGDLVGAVDRFVPSSGMSLPAGVGNTTNTNTNNVNIYNTFTVDQQNAAAAERQARIIADQIERIGAERYNRIA